MWLRIFQHGPDRDQLIEVDDAAFRDPLLVDLEGCALRVLPAPPFMPGAGENWLVSFTHLGGERGELPCWLPERLLSFEFYQLPRPSSWLVRSLTTHEIAAIDGPVVGWGIVTIPAWLADRLPLLSAHRLQLARAERAASKEDERRADAEAARRMSSAARKKSPKTSTAPLFEWGASATMNSVTTSRQPSVADRLVGQPPVQRRIA